MGTNRDAIPLLVEQHRQIADLFRRTIDATGRDRKRYFRQLRRLVVAHETAEEILVHPRLRWLHHDGDELARARVEEETRLKAELAALQSMDPESTQFTEGLAAGRALAQSHNNAEEAAEFPALTDLLDEPARRRLARRVKLVEKLGPTRPHPGLALGGENLLAGGFTAIADRARDLFERAAR